MCESKREGLSGLEMEGEFPSKKVAELIEVANSKAMTYHKITNAAEKIVTLLLEASDVAYDATLYKSATRLNQAAANTSRLAQQGYRKLETARNIMRDLGVQLAESNGDKPW